MGETLSGVERAALYGAAGVQGVWVRPELVRACGGDAGAAIVLAQLLYMGKVHEDDSGSFYVTTETLERMTGMGYRSQRRAFRRLETLGFAETELRGMPRRRWVRLRKRAILEAVVGEEEKDGAAAGEADAARELFLELFGDERGGQEAERREAKTELRALPPVLERQLRTVGPREAIVRRAAAELLDFFDPPDGPAGARKWLRDVDRCLKAAEDDVAEVRAAVVDGLHAGLMLKGPGSVIGVLQARAARRRAAREVGPREAPGGIFQ